MKNTTLKIILVIGLVCAAFCALCGLIVMSVGESSFIIAVITGVAASVPISAELYRVDKRLAAESKTTKEGNKEN